MSEKEPTYSHFEDEVTEDEITDAIAPIEYYTQTREDEAEDFKAVEDDEDLTLKKDVAYDVERIETFGPRGPRNA